MTTVIWLARHAQAHNPSAVLYGRLPRVRLSEAGQREARALGELLASRPLGALYSSPMLRARQTASAIAAAQPRPLPIHLSQDLHEIRSSWQGRPLAELDAVRWDFYTTPRQADDERLHVIRDRMCRWVTRVLRRHPGEEVVGVSHGDPILVLIAQLKGRLLDIASIRQGRYPPTGSVYRLQLEPNGAAQSVELIVPTDRTADTITR